MPILKTTICSEVSTRRKHYGLETLEPVQKPILNTLYKNRMSDDLVLDLNVNISKHGYSKTLNGQINNLFYINDFNISFFHILGK